LNPHQLICDVLELQEMEIAVIENTIVVESTILQRDITYTLFIPEEKVIAEPLALLLMNDGQDAENLRLKDTLHSLYENNRVRPFAVAAIHAGEERVQEYGVASKADFKDRGAKAGLYTQFIIDELLPAIKNALNAETFAEVAYAGFSLGGLSAIDIVWNHPEVFSRVGVFSGSFWWRSKALDKGYTDEDRIMHRVIRNSDVKPEIKFWLQTGTKDETADRNKNGIIDSIDDTIDLIKELEQKGYSRPADIKYVELVGGQHNVETWCQAMPKFLCWAFGT
jgi:enterochelin esterase family protein